MHLSCTRSIWRFHTFANTYMMALKVSTLVQFSRIDDFEFDANDSG